MGIDQSHVELNTVIKRDRGAIRLTEDPEKFHGWMLCGPESARISKEFENVSVLKEDINSQYRYYEDTPAFQRKFKNHYRYLIEEFEKLGNPFVCNGDETDLICMDTRDVM